MQVGFIWLRTGCSDEILETWQWSFGFHMRQGMPSIRIPSEAGTVEPSVAYLHTYYRPCPLHRNYVAVFLRHVVATHCKTNEVAITPEVDAPVSKLVALGTECPFRRVPEHGSFIEYKYCLFFLLNNQPDAIIIQMELQFHPDSAWKRPSETCMKLTSAECTVQ